jgi:hypothetical protein
VKDTNYGHQLEAAGWLQTRIIRPEHIAHLACNAHHLIEINPDEILGTDCVLIVASQSCDIANLQYPFVELRVGFPISKVNGSFTHNNHPRKLHLSIFAASEEGIQSQAFEVNIHQKILVSKQELAKVVYCENSDLDEQAKRDFRYWLAAQYTRPALPTKFNDRLSAADPKRSQRKAAKSLHKNALGIYVEIIPFAELPPEQQYSVNLLVMLEAGADSSDAQIVASSEKIKGLMEAAGMNVNLQIRKETEISVALLKRFSRLYLDALSFKDESSILPPDLKPTL